MTAEPRPGSGTPDADDGHTINVGPVTVADPGSGTPDPTPNGQTWVCRNGRPTARCVEDCPVAAGCGPVPPAPSSDTPSDERLCGHCAASNDPSPAHRYIVGRVARQCPGRPAPSPVPEASGRPDPALLRAEADDLDYIARSAGWVGTDWSGEVDRAASTLRRIADHLDPAPSSSHVGDRGVDELRRIAIEGLGTEDVPSVDVCAWCWDSECDGIGCIASLDPDNPDHHERIERLHLLLRAGHALLAAADREERTDV